MVNPADAHTRAKFKAFGARPQLVHPADDFMAGNDRQARRRRSTFDLVQLGVTDTAGGDADADFAGGRFGVGQVDEFERRFVFEE